MGIVQVKLIEEWDIAVKRFWSFRLSLLAAILSTAEIVMQVWQPKGIPSGTFAALAVMVSLAAALARIIAQPKAYRD